MIDLNKLEERFKALFEQETEDSFKEWLYKSKGINLDEFLGEGDYISLNSVSGECALVGNSQNIILSNGNNITAGNIQYAMAA